VASEVRGKLGEPRNSIQNFGTNLEQATTGSLEALQIYSLGMKSVLAGDNAAAVPILQRAVEVDPNFALAYASLGTAYGNLGENKLAAESIGKAYELRELVSAREKFFIESAYHFSISGDLEKCRTTLQLFAQTYPRDALPRNDLGYAYLALGQYDLAFEEFQAAHSLNPARSQSYFNLISTVVALNRFDEARTMVQEAQRLGPDSPDLRELLYHLAFLQNDYASMDEHILWAKGKVGAEDIFFQEQADTFAYSGNLSKARRLTLQAVNSATQAAENETAGVYKAVEAVREALVGNSTEAQRAAIAALKISDGRDVQYLAALGLLIAGGQPKVESISKDLASRFPTDTIVHAYFLPTLRAQFSLNAKRPMEAIEALQVTTPYELVGESDSAIGCTSLYPIYVRGQAYINARSGKEAAAEFQKILDHRGIVLNGLVGALAHLGLARAFVLQGDGAKARAKYRDFLALWKDAACLEGGEDGIREAAIAGKNPA
jgi:eukaryotic-like serine/threonine-protein kinase